METKVSYTLAGMFIIVLMSVIIFGVIWLSGGFNNKKYTYYQVNMTEAISGLSKDGPVEFNGVNVGIVKNIKISRENPRLVIVILKVEKDAPVTMGTKAKLSMRALSGISYILLEDQGTDKRSLAIMEGQTYPIIPTTPSILVQLDTLLREFSTNFHQLNISIQSLLNKQNLKNVQQILKTGNETFQLIEHQTVPAANDAINNLGAMTRSLGNISNDIKQDPSVLIRGKSMPTKLGPGE